MGGSWVLSRQCLVLESGIRYDKIRWRFKGKVRRSKPRERKEIKMLTTPPVSLSRTHRHANGLLDLISQYPQSNATLLKPTAPQSSPPHPSDTSSGDGSQVSTLDMTKIRSKYKVLCATLGVTPRLAPASTAHLGTSAPRVGDVLTKAAVSMEYDIDEDLDEHPVTKARRNKVNTIWAVDRKGNSSSDNGF